MMPLYIAKEITLPLSTSNKSFISCCWKKMKELKHMMIDLYFQGSPPLPLVMDFFIYQQLSLAFSVCPVQPALSLKCCVKHIPALAFCCQPKSFFALAANRLLIFQHQIPHAFTFYITMCLAMAGSG